MNKMKVKAYIHYHTCMSTQQLYLIYSIVEIFEGENVHKFRWGLGMLRTPFMLNFLCVFYQSAKVFSLKNFLIYCNSIVYTVEISPNVQQTQQLCLVLKLTLKVYGRSTKLFTTSV